MVRQKLMRLGMVATPLVVFVLTAAPRISGR